MKIELPVTDHGSPVVLFGHNLSVVIDYQYLNKELFIVTAVIKMRDGNHQVCGSIKKEQYSSILRLYGQEMIVYAEKDDCLAECECQAI